MSLQGPQLLAGLEVPGSVEHGAWLYSLVGVFVCGPVCACACVRVNVFGCVCAKRVRVCRRASARNMQVKHGWGSEEEGWGGCCCRRIPHYQRPVAACGHSTLAIGRHGDGHDLPAVEHSWGT